MPSSVKELVMNVRELAKEYPDAVYSKTQSGVCYYDRGAVKNGPNGEGCIFGHASIKSTEFAEKPSSITGVIRELFDFDDIHENVIDWCQTVQAYQDNGVRWSEAVELADKEVGPPEEYLQ